MKSRYSVLLLVIALVLTTAGCGSNLRLYVNPEADMSYYDRIAVVPFSNFTGERFAGVGVCRQFTTELLIAGRFNVIEESEFNSALDRVGGEANIEGQYDPAKLKAAASELSATAILRGAVTEYKMQRVGNSDSPVVTFDVELQDVATGNVVWRASVTRKGKGTFPLLGGDGTRTFGRLVQQACRDMVGRLESEVF